MVDARWVYHHHVEHHPVDGLVEGLRVAIRSNHDIACVGEQSITCRSSKSMGLDTARAQNLGVHEVAASDYRILNLLLAARTY